MLFSFIQVLCILNFMFFLQHFINFIFIKKMGRFFDFPNFTQISDASLFTTSFILFLWVGTEIKNGVSAAEQISEEAMNEVLVQNFTNSMNFNY